jgi:hypothetical protein
MVLAISKEIFNKIIQASSKIQKNERNFTVNTSVSKFLIDGYNIGPKQ